MKDFIWQQLILRLVEAGNSVSVSRLILINKLITKLGNNTLPAYLI